MAISEAERQRLYAESINTRQRTPLRQMFGGEAGEMPSSREPGRAPTPTIPQARERRDESMAAVDGNASEDWKDAAWSIVRLFPANHVFMAEDVRDALDAKGLVVHDRRALGPVIMAMARGGLIEKAGYRAARTSNLSPKVEWRRIAPDA